MNRDNVLYTTVGLLAGFIVGYLAHETVASRQPLPGWTLAAAEAQLRAGAATGGGAPAGAAMGGGTMGGGAAGPTSAAPAAAGMEEVQRLAAYVAENPEDADAVRMLGNLNYDIQNWSRAAELYERYLALRGREVDVMTDLGVVYRNLGRPQDALGLFAEVRELDPEHWQSRFNEVIVLAFDVEDLDAAWEASQELRRLQPDNPQVERLVAELERRRTS